MSTNDHTNVKNEELTLKQIIQTIQDYFHEVLKCWKLSLFFIIPFIALFLYKALITPNIYSSSLTFMINEDEGGGMGGAMAILNQFNLGGGSQHNYEKIIELSKSRRITQLALFEKRSINGQNDYLANHIIEIYNLNDLWEDSESLRNFKFTSDRLVAGTNLIITKNTVIKALHSILIGSEDTPGIYFTDIDVDTGIMTLSLKSKSEELSVELLNSIYHYLSQYYVEKTTEKQQYTYELIKNKVDSLQKKLHDLEYTLANFIDSNRGVWANTASLKKKRLERDVQVTTLMYGEALKNLEIADFSLKTKTPYIQLIDYPIYPLRPKKTSKLVALIVGGIIGFFMFIVFIITRKIILDAMIE